MLPLILGFFWLLVAFSMIYMLIIFLFTFGWFRTPVFFQRVKTLPEVSVVVTVRNESRHIISLLKKLAAQDYTEDKYEIVIVNDHSEDDTVELIRQFQKKNKSFPLRLLEATGEGKKAALKTGIEQAKYELIATTDGDCSMSELWLQRMASFHTLKKPRLVAGPVVYSHKKGLLQHFFMLDFMGLVASGAGSLGVGLPLMANGANLMFTQETYFDVLSQIKGKSHASGDDIFLLHTIMKKYGYRKIRFIKDTLAIVKTEPPENFRQFFWQRVRWSSKATAYRSWWAILVSVTVFLFHLLLLLSLPAIILKTWFVIIYLLFVLLKMVIDFPLLRHFSEFVGRKQSLYYLFFFGWVYPFYIVAAAVFSFSLSYSWKGRHNLK